jgi:hypothetical protein
MLPDNYLKWAGIVCTGFACALGPLNSSAQDAGAQNDIRELKAQNSRLQEQIEKQQKLIDGLSRQVSRIRENELAKPSSGEAPAVQEPSSSALSAFSLGKVNLSGEGGVALFKSGKEGPFRNTEFRIDEARLFVEAPVLENVYFFAELNLVTREMTDVSLRLGELYLDFENVSRLWGQDHLVSLRLGRLDIPFGEEYLYRDAIDNPLISHSLSDIWGINEGIEIYGRLGKVSYLVAAQNGGVPDGVDNTADKSVTARLAYDPFKWLHLGVSALRTGDVDVTKDHLSAVWFGNGFFRSIGSEQTSQFHTDMVQGDLRFRLPHGHVAAFGGFARYADNDPAAQNKRDIFYYSLEAVQNIFGKAYAGARFSQIFADKGYPLTGNGDMGEYFFNPAAPLTDNIWRLSLGLGYRWSPNLVTKGEYTFERGHLVGGGRRDAEDLFALEAAFKF